MFDSLLAIVGAVGLFSQQAPCCGADAASAAECTSTTAVAASALKPLPAPKEAADREYLGLPAEAENFKLTDIQAEFLLVDVFDMYCHVCGRTAPDIKGFHETIAERKLDRKIKFLGLAVNNSPLEARTFRKKYSLPFPVFSDRRREVSSAFGRPRTPTLLVVKLSPNQMQVVYNHQGSIVDAAKLLDEVLKAAGDQP